MCDAPLTSPAAGRGDAVLPVTRSRRRCGAHAAGHAPRAPIPARTFTPVFPSPLSLPRRVDPPYRTTVSRSAAAGPLPVPTPGSRRQSLLGECVRSTGPCLDAGLSSRARLPLERPRPARAFGPVAGQISSAPIAGVQTRPRTGLSVRRHSPRLGRVVRHPEAVEDHRESGEPTRLTENAEDVFGSTREDREGAERGDGHPEDEDEAERDGQHRAASLAVATERDVRE